MTQPSAPTASDRPSIDFGDFRLTLFSDGTYLADGGAMFGVVPKSLWSRKVNADDQNRITCGLTSVVIDTGKQKVLVETGIGSKLDPKLKAIYATQEQLLENLAGGGVRPEDIDIVINSHLHFDHCGWNTRYENGEAVSTFPNARYFTQRGEWEHAQRQLERDRISYISDNYNPLVQSGQMTLLDGAAVIVPGIRVEIFPGHTRHLMGVIIESGGRTACYASDLIPSAAHLDLTWVMAYDLFPLETIESRRRYYARAIPEKWLTIFTHDHFTPWGFVEAKGGTKFAVSGRPD